MFVWTITCVFLSDEADILRHQAALDDVLANL